LYVMGNPIYPPNGTNNVNSYNNNNNNTANADNDAQVKDMYQRYCRELLRIFDRHKESYAKGWINKNLTIITE
jgi:hypothetical protein